MESPSCRCGTAAFTTRTSGKEVDLEGVFKLLAGQFGHVGANKLLGKLTTMLSLPSCYTI
jgi:hypothetical protein